MQQVLRLFFAAIAAVALVHFSGLVSAQSPVKQIKLSEKQIEGFISAHKDMAAVTDKIQSDKPIRRSSSSWKALPRSSASRASTTTTRWLPTSPW